MYKTLGYTAASFGGVIILGMFADVLGQLANVMAGHYYHNDSSFAIETGIVAIGLVLFAFGVRWMNGSVGVVFLSIGGLSFLTTLMPTIIDFVEISSTLQTPFSMGQGIGHCLVLIFGITLFVIGIRRLSAPQKDESLIDDLN